MRLPLIAVLLSLPVTAMAQITENEVYYQCADRRELHVLYLNVGEDTSALIQEAGHWVLMSQTESASGARYVSSDNWYELDTKGDMATLSLLGENETVLYRDCNVDPRTAAG